MIGEVQMRALRAVAAGASYRQAVAMLKGAASGAVATGIIDNLIRDGFIHRHRGGRLSVTERGRAELPVPRVFVGTYTPPRVVRRPGSMDFANAPSLAGGQLIPWRRA